MRILYHCLCRWRSLSKFSDIVMIQIVIGLVCVGAHARRRTAARDPNSGLSVAGDLRSFAPAYELWSDGALRGCLTNHPPGALGMRLNAVVLVGVASMTQPTSGNEPVSWPYGGELGAIFRRAV